MPNQWYVKIHESAEPIGPLTDRELIDLAAANRISLESLVANGSKDKWSPASKVSKLFELAKSRGNKSASTTGESEGSGEAEVKTQRTQEIAELNRRITEYELQAADLKRDFGAISNSVESQMVVHGKVDELAKSLAELIERMSEADAQLRQRDSTIADQSSTIAVQGTLIQAILARLQSQEDTHAILARVSAEQNELRQRVDQNANAIEVVKQQTFEFSSAIERLSSSIESETEARVSGNFSLEQELKSIQAEFLLLSTRSAAIQSECVALREKLSASDSYAERFLVNPELTRITYAPETHAELQPEIDIEFPKSNADGLETSTTPLDESVDSLLPEDDSINSMVNADTIEPETIEIEDLSADRQLESEVGPFITSEDSQGSPTNSSSASFDHVASIFETGSEAGPVEDMTTATLDQDDLPALLTQTLPESLEVSPTQTPVETTDNANGSDTFEIDFEFHRRPEQLVARGSEIETDSAEPELQPEIDIEFPKSNADGLETSTTPLDESVDSLLPEDDSINSVGCPAVIEPETIEIEDLSADRQLESEEGPFLISEDSQGSPTNASPASFDHLASIFETGSEAEPVEDRTTATLDRDDLPALLTQTLPENLEVSPTQTPVETTDNANGSDTFEIDFEFQRRPEQLVAGGSEIETDSAEPELQPEIDIEFPKSNADGLETSTTPLGESVDSLLPEDDSINSMVNADTIEPETIEIEDLSADRQLESEVGPFITSEDSQGSPTNSSSASSDFEEPFFEPRSDDGKSTQSFSTSSDQNETGPLAPNEVTSRIELGSPILLKSEEVQEPCSVRNDELSDHFKSIEADDGPVMVSEVLQGLKKQSFVDDLCELHSKLQEHFSSLFENRSALGLGVFLLEHEIEEDKFERAVSSVRDCLQRYSLADHGWWWAARYLPLLVVASEEGYVYEGNGTDYWPRLERKLGFHFDHASRRQLSKFFERSTSECGIAKPPDTPWHRKYCHIAWPITNAVLPLDMRIPFAETLRMLPGHIQNYDDDSLMRFLRQATVDTASNRYSNWLKSESVPAHLARYVLQSDYDKPFLSLNTLLRIRTDLLAETTARRAILEAVGNQERKSPSGTPRNRRANELVGSASDNTAPLNCLLFLRRLDESKFQLETSLPNPPPSSRIWLQHQLRTRKWDPKQWGVNSAPSIGISSLLFNAPCPIDVRCMLKREKGIGFLTGWQVLNPDTETTQWLERVEVSPQLPLFFRPDSELRFANQHLASFVSVDQLLWVLIEEVDNLPIGITRLGATANLSLLQVDPSEQQAAAWLESYGIRTGTQVQWRCAHDPSHPIMGSLVCMVGDFFAYEVVALNGQRDVRVYCTTPSSSQSVINVEEDGIFGLPIDKPGMYEFSIWSGERLLDKRSFQAEAGFNQTESAFQIQLLGGDATVTSLIQSQLKLEILSRRDLRQVVVTLQLGATKLKTLVSEFPLRIATLDETWRKLLTDSNRRALASGADVFLSVDIAGIESRTWRLVNEIADISWEIRDLNRPVAMNDDHELEVVQLSLDSVPPKPTFDIASASLFVAKKDDELCFDLGTVIHSPRTSSFPVIPRLPDRFERRMEATQTNCLGLQELIELYIAIVTSRASHSVAALYQDKYKSTVKHCIFELILGRRWIERQEQQESLFSVPMEVLIDRAVKKRAGFNSNFHETVKVTTELRKRAMAEMLIVLPTRWWMLPSSEFSDDHAARLDRAIGNSYQELAWKIEDPVVRAIWESADPFTPTSSWRLVLHEASQLLNGAYLAEQVLPTEMGEAILKETLIDMSVAEVSELLHSWINQFMSSYWSRTHWTTEWIEIAMLMFERPQSLRRKDWQGVASLILRDRFVSRAIAFTAWRRLQLEALGG